MTATVRNLRSRWLKPNRRREVRKTPIREAKDPELVQKLLHWQPLSDDKPS